ncbi:MULTISPECIES: Fic family protein [unclassified Variovorax]|uniref:Fic family protein n=1 Tax=unclassified Variovorax TaxID=663243 RepID=UPI00076D32C9|nr:MULTISPECIES: Fic family protein [unclassified Variovorax]KWT95588.1 fic family protein [Variovorax sp. WDL1]PNG50200.1 hypothetical protein CHC06_05823 [Variovorax sp. B2]PNG51073.1 hypothetical protein CHC07_05729 [Variovorax sp. B4]VTU42312.1 Fic/DOC family protein [Variovorax sp. SRS16]VTU42337.1 Fic/DOC family protein [Variovorax sp. PBL-E5]
MKKTTTVLDDTLVLYAELSSAQVRTAQRRLAAGDLKLVAKGFATSLPEGDWEALVARHRTRVLAAFFPGTVVSFRTAFDGGSPSKGTVFLVGTYRRTVELPGLTVEVWKGPPPQAGDGQMMGRPIYFASEPRMLLENLSPSRGESRRSVGAEAVERRLLDICHSRGEEALSQLRERARELVPELGLEDEFSQLDGLVGSILNSRPSVLTTREGKALTAAIPYDSARLELFENFAQRLRAVPLPIPASSLTTDRARRNFAFLESYFSNFIEGTEFAVEEARGFVLEGVPVVARPKDSHDIIGVFEQALSPTWSTLTLPAGEPVLEQLRARHKKQMENRPEVGPGEFKLVANRAGNTEFVLPPLVRGTLVEGSKLLLSVPEGTARALLAMFLVAEVHPFNDGNGRLARLVMNAELSAVDGCRIIVPTLYREEYLDCLRVLTREGDPAPFIKVMCHIHDWTSRFSYDDIDQVISDMRRCNAFERSRNQFELLMP